MIDPSVQPDPDRSLADAELPSVSVILPIRNEGAFIDRSLGAVLGQDYPSDRLEVLVVDGMSDDDTRDRVKALSDGDVSVRLLDNPGRIVPTAMNIGIREAQGRVIVRVDGHTIIADDYLRCSVEALHRTKAHNVGGLMRAVADGYLRRVITAATSSPFGVGNAVFHYSEQEREADTVYLGVYPRWVLEHVGMYDEEFVRNQDDELNDRVRKAGGRIMLCPELKSDYYPRSTMWRLAKQYFQYGWWKVRCYQNHPREVSLVHLVPGGFAAAFAVGAILTPFVTPVLWLWLAMMCAYTAGAVVFSLRAGNQQGWSVVPMMPPVFLTLHLSYGLGFIMGSIRFARRWKGSDVRMAPLPDGMPLWNGLDTSHEEKDVNA
jgi:succinoglycan biosynthesis protein ExoA